MSAVREQLERFLGLAPPEWLPALARHAGVHLPARAAPDGNAGLAASLLPALERASKLPPEQARALLAEPLARLGALAIASSVRAEKALGCLAQSRTPWAGIAREIVANRRFLTQLLRTAGPEEFGRRVAHFSARSIDTLPLALFSAAPSQLTIDRFLRGRVGDIASGPFAVARELFEERFGETPAARVQRVRREVLTNHGDALAHLAAGLPAGLLAKIAMRLSSFEHGFPNVARYLLKVLFFAALEALEAGVQVSLDVPRLLRFRAGFDPAELTPVLAALVRRAARPCSGAGRERFVRVRWDALRGGGAIAIEGGCSAAAGDDAALAGLRDRIGCVGGTIGLAAGDGKGMTFLVCLPPGEIRDGTPLPLFPRTPADRPAAERPASEAGFLARSAMQPWGAYLRKRMQAR